MEAIAPTRHVGFGSLWLRDTLEFVVPGHIDCQGVNEHKAQVRVDRGGVEHIGNYSEGFVRDPGVQIVRSGEGVEANFRVVFFC